ncbi:FYVE, RhoGEF and PH domain-containing protein 6, partial [Tinamus guttatus]
FPSSPEIKKPPVAPKPKFAMGQKATPPPVAPKPDVVLSGVIQATKKTKPAIAPKPKVLKSLSTVEARPVSCLRKGTKSLEEHRGDSTQTLDHLNYKNETSEESTDNTAYILPMSPCKFECLHKLGNGDNTCKSQIIFEHFENLENIKVGEQAALALGNGHNEKLANKNQVVLKASILEEKLKDALSQSVFPNSSPMRHKCADKLNGGNSTSSKNNVKTEFMELVQPSSSFEEAKGKQQNTDSKLTVAEFGTSETCPSLSENNHNCSCSLDQGLLENKNLSSSGMFSEETCVKADIEKTLLSSETCLVASPKILPIPKPRKPRAAYLVRQDGIDTAGEGTKEPSSSENDSFGLSDQNFKKPAKINILGQSVSYNKNTEVLRSEKSEITQNVAQKIDQVKEPADTEESTSQNLLPQMSRKTSNLVENFECSLEKDLNLVNTVDKTTDDASSLDAVDKRTNFIRCDALSMSLPKQLKLTGSQHLPTSSSLHVSPQKMEDKEVKVKDESSPKIVPKKPQRHSLPAAGLLKKAASAELVEKSSYPCSEDKKPSSLLEGTHGTHTPAKEQGLLASCDIPKRSSEKPVWKLPHPILPFSGNSESLKTPNVTTSFNHATVVTKPRAKSLSSVDMERTDKPCKDPQKKNSLKKFLNMKLSVCLMKSDFHRFLSKGSHSMDSAIASHSAGEGHGNGSSRNIASISSERKGKSAKAHSMEISSPALQKKRQRNRSQPEMRTHQRMEPSEGQLLSGEHLPQMHFSYLTSNCAPEYENVRHYEEIPEYENLPFALGAGKNLCFEWQSSSSVEDQSSGMYVVDEPYEATSRRSRHDR